MDAVSYSKAAQQAARISRIIAEPDSTSGLVTMPSVIASGETTTIPAGRVVVHPNLQVDGVLDVQGTLFVPAGGSISEVIVNTDVLVVDTSAILPSNTAIGSVSAAELGYIDGVTSNIQAQLDSKQRMQLMTAQNSTSGTSIDFTGIPSWAKKITVMFNGVNTSGTSNILVRLGTSGGLTVVGYSSVCITGATAVGNTTGYLVTRGVLVTSKNSGSVIIENITSNSWISSGNLADLPQLYLGSSAGAVTLSGTLDRIRVTTVNGTDTFCAGQINVLYEG